MPNISKKKNIAKGMKASGKKPLKAKVLKIKNSDESLHLRRLTVSSQSVVNKKAATGSNPFLFCA